MAVCCSSFHWRTGYNHVTLGSVWRGRRSLPAEASSSSRVRFAAGVDVLKAPNPGSVRPCVVSRFDLVCAYYRRWPSASCRCPCRFTSPPGKRWRRRGCWPSWNSCSGETGAAKHTRCSMYSTGGLFCDQPISVYSIGSSLSLCWLQLAPFGVFRFLGLLFLFGFI